MLIGGDPRAVGLHVLDARTKRREVAGALTMAVFRRGKEIPEAIVAAKAGKAAWAPGAPPAPDSPAAAVPYVTIERLLGVLGHLKPTDGRAAPGERDAAIAAFQADRGLPVTGQPSLALLGRLIEAAQ